MTDHEPFMRRAIDLSREAVDRGDRPFGTVLVRDGEIVAEARNTVATDDDVTAHPELKLARWAARKLAPDEIAETTMYTSTEPCPMCAGGFYHAGLRHLVFATPTEALVEFGRTALVVPCTDIFDRGEEHVEVVGPVLEAKAREVHETFW